MILSTKIVVVKVLLGYCSVVVHNIDFDKLNPEHESIVDEIVSKHKHRCRTTPIHNIFTSSSQIKRKSYRITKIKPQQFEVGDQT